MRRFFLDPFDESDWTDRRILARADVDHARRHVDIGRSFSGGVKRCVTRPGAVSVGFMESEYY
jgi:hypothetical protein